jgi:excisionase family DNA binding protein
MFTLHKKTLTPQDLASETGLSARRIQQLIRDRTIPALKGGKPYYISRPSAERFKKERLLCRIFSCKYIDFRLQDEFVSDFEGGNIAL